MEQVNPLRDPELDMLALNKESGFNYRERRHDSWTEIYDLYRDTVQTNRLIQRQSVNIPIMKQTVRTLLKDVDDMPVLYFENLDNDKEAEIFKNEYWKWTVEQNRMDLQDIVDKRQVLLFGRSYDQWQIIDGRVVMTVQDPMDILVSRYTDPFNINTSRFLIHTHIFVPLASLEFNPDYDKHAVSELVKWHASDQGLLKSKQSEQMLIDKNQKMEDMGLSDVASPVLGETYVELSLHFVYRENEKYKDSKTGEEREYPEQIFLYVEADDQQILMKKPLEDVIGVTSDHYWQNHFPYCSWADDLERQDWYSDGVGDIVKTPNKVVNSWFSQEVENRTLANLGMNIYDATANEGWQPQTWEPRAWGWYGVPGNPAHVYQKLDIQPLSGNLEGMEWVLGVIKEASGATSTQAGVQTERQVTLGEVQLALGEAKERIKGMSKFYTPAWKQRGEIFIKLVEAGADKLDAVKVYKKGKSTNNIYSREIGPKDWKSASGYRCQVWSQDEKNEQDIQSLEKISAVSAMIPGNPKLEEIKKRKALEFAGLTPDEINDVMEIEQAKQEALMSMVGQQGVEAPGLPAPVAPIAPVPAAPVN